jgi:hypothetical protein
MSGYDWIKQNLSSADFPSREVIMYSSHLGASIASSIALTETRVLPVGPTHTPFSQPFPVKGLIAYNGIYNWTMFLPDHKVNKQPKAKAATARKMKDLLDEIKAPPPPTSLFDTIKAQMPGLFQMPVNLFDDFASPALMFQTAGLHVPASFTQPHELAAAIDRLALGSGSSLNPLSPDLKAPRRTPLQFPPGHSGQQIPDMLLLYSQPPSPLKKRKARKTTAAKPKATKPKGHHFHIQAVEFAELARRGLAKSNFAWLRGQGPGDGAEMETDEYVEGRIQAVDVGEETGLTPNDFGSALIARWLEDKVSCSC